MADLATAGLDTVAVRVPDHPVARQLLAALRPAGGGAVGQPLRPCLADHAPRTCSPICDGRIDLIVDGGATPVGVESTIVACLDEPMLLRPGGLSRQAIERALGRPLAERAGSMPADDAPLAPGMLASHYAPRTPLRLDAERVERRRSVAGVRARAGRDGADKRRDRS